jgi:mycothiol synthase
MRDLLLPRPHLPGLRFRTYAGEQDIPAIAELLQASYDANGETIGIDPDDLINETRNLSHIDPAEDMVLGFIEGRLVARSMIDWADTHDGAARHYQSWGDVDPAWRRKGIGAAMWRRNIERLSRLAAVQAYAGERILSVPWLRSGDTGGLVLAQRLGYRQARVYHHMTRPTLEAIDVPPLPTGLEVRPVAASDLPAIWSAMIEAFRDHYGAWDTGDAAYRTWAGSPTLDPSLLVIAFDGSAIAGGVHAEIQLLENERQGYDRGWTDPIWVRRPWRRRGLASALLGRALLRLRDRGMSSAQLDVDTENANQALTLYERHGFVSDREATEWHKPLV